MSTVKTFHLNVTTPNGAYADNPYFYIAGRSFSGGRYYSENMTYEEALSIMSKYISVVDYFGGGIVQLLDWNGSILKEKYVY